ncbi:hypothetical protein ACFWDI_36370 [Streptomyces sp. NPDC060064]|uniref:hypothetical protein n=1 Tax=Streptomyces sp. NPDC060064 TaxID=3347049 RepID=UPI0036BCE790
MADEPSNGELGRLIQALRDDWREDMGQLNQRLDKVVPMNVYTVERNQLMDRVVALETHREKDAERLVATRRWMLGVVITVVVAVLPYLATIVRGAAA